MWSEFSGGCYGNGESRGSRVGHPPCAGHREAGRHVLLRHAVQRWCTSACFLFFSPHTISYLVALVCVTGEVYLWARLDRKPTKQADKRFKKYQYSQKTCKGIYFFSNHSVCWVLRFGHEGCPFRVLFLYRFHMERGRWFPDRAWILDSRPSGSVWERTPGTRWTGTHPG